MKMENRIELCCHTKMSKLQGINSVKEYVEEAKNREYSAIAITDTDGTQAFFEVNECLKNDDSFKIIYGTELTFKENEDSKKTYKIYIYVKEQKGLKNLYKVVSNAYLNLENDKPIVYKNILDKYRDGLLYAAIGSKSKVYENIDNLNINKILDYYDFIGIEPNSEKEINKKISEICAKNNKLLIGTSECNFIDKENYKCNEILNLYKKINNIKEGNNKYFQNTNELIESLSYIENAKEIVVDNTIKLANEIENIKLIPKRATYPQIENSKEIIKNECYEKAYKLYGKELPINVQNRLDLELNSIIKNNFETIYLIYSELVKYSNKLGYKTSNRGSVGDSFVAYLLGIININPLKYNLPFEIFAGSNYDIEPDIVINFSSEIHYKIFEYLQKRFGKDKVIWCGTVGTLCDGTVEEINEKYIEQFKINSSCDKEKIMSKLIGVKNCTGEHLGAVFIIPNDMDISDFCPTEIGTENQLKTHNDYHSIWYNSGLYKFDFICNNNLTVLHELEKETKTDSDDIDLNDKAIIELLAHANDKSYKIIINGIPEFSSNYVKNIIEIAKPQKFNDFVCISALSHGTNTWLDNADFLIKSDNKKVDEVISNREDMYNYLCSKGIEKDIAYTITTFVRKGKASNTKCKEKWNEYKEIMKKHDIPEWYIKSAEKIQYMFPKSHGIDYTMVAFKIAWYKINYPKIFYETYFKIESDLDVNDYYCKKQVKAEIEKLKAEMELAENEKNYNKSFECKDKIKDLEMVLEMFDNKILNVKN